MSDLLTTLKSRGMAQDATPELGQRLAQGPVIGYVGFDPTAASLHVGNLVPIMALAWLQRLGGTPIILVGGATGLVGDPSGKRQERPVLDEAVAKANADSIRSQLVRFLDFDGPNAARVRNNSEWLSNIKLLDFLRDTGKHFTINYMLQKESVRSRMETGISYTEFSYMLIQAYDFLQLYREEDCQLQLGGSDQWGNITAGIELIGRAVGGKAHGLVLPLLTTSSGGKFGKTEGGNVWLDPERTSPYRFYQFWLNSDDREVEKYLRIFTFLSLEEIGSIMAGHEADPGERSAQRALAREVTRTVHGPEAVAGAEQASGILFGGADITQADPAVFPVLAEEAPVTTMDRSDFGDGLSLVDALVACGLASSKGEARRGLQAKGFSVNGTPTDEVSRVLVAGDLLADRWILLRKGKKNYALLDTGG